MTDENTNSVRPPIVVVMGHVDHGKSTLLDYIRKSNIVAGEAGGITQHVAAYEVTHNGKRITFIDTPGHAAFKTIRARGANIADIAILVVAADDGVKAQTLEALESIKASETPFIVAINKIDKPNADVEKTKYALLEHGVYLEGLGGDVSFTPISAKSGEGVSDLLDLVLLAAELENYTGDTVLPGTGYVLESNRDEKRGIAATIIITNGSIATGKFIQAGSAVAPLRLFEDHMGKALKSASYSTPVRIFGFDTMPQVGAICTVHATKKAAEEAAAETARMEAVVAATEPHEGSYVVPLVIKADTASSLEAVLGQLAPLNTEEIGFRVIHTGLGPVSESDIKTALASPERDPLVVGFTVDTDRMAAELARQNNIQILHFDIIYKLTEELTEVLRSRKPEKKVETVQGKARVLKCFSSRHDEHLIGGRVDDGYLIEGARVRIVRKGDVVATGELLGMQVARQKATKVEKGSEFGAQVVLSEAPHEGDVIEAFSTSIH